MGLVVGDSLLVVYATIQGDIHAEGQESHAASLKLSGVYRKPGCYPPDHGHDQPTPNRGPKAVDGETRQKPGYQAKHGGIDHDKEEPQGEYRDWKGEEYKHRLHNGADDAEQKRGEDKGSPTIDAETWNEIGREPQAQRHYNQANENGHRVQLTNAVKTRSDSSSCPSFFFRRHQKLRLRFERENLVSLSGSIDR